MSRQRAIQENNQHRSEGAIAPNPIAVALRWSEIIDVFKIAFKGDSYEAIVLLVFLWLRLKVDWRKKSEHIPHFIRVTSTNINLTLLDKTEGKEIVFIRLCNPSGGKSAVEYTHVSTVDKNSKEIWLPIPKALTPFVRSYINQQPYDTTLFHNIDKTNFCNIIEKAFKRKNNAINHKLATFTQWSGFLIKSALVDEVFNSDAKRHYVGEEKLSHQHAHVYVDETVGEMRKSIYIATNAYTQNITHALENFGCSTSLNISLFNDANEINEQLFCKGVKQREAKYLSTAGNEIPLTHSNNKEIAQKLAAQGTTKSRLPKKQELVKFLQTLYENLKAIKPSKSTTRKDWLDYHNYLTFSLLVYFMTLTNSRPNHFIGPANNLRSVDTVYISDKAILRAILLPEYLQRQFERYAQHLVTIKQIFPPFVEQEPFLILLSSQGLALNPTAKTMKAFINTIAPEFSDNILRKMFSNLMQQQGCPSSLKALYMGHLNNGEEDGIRNSLPQEQKMYRVYLERYAASLNLRELLS